MPPIYVQNPFVSVLTRNSQKLIAKELSEEEWDGKNSPLSLLMSFTIFIQHNVFTLQKCKRMNIPGLNDTENNLFSQLLYTEL